MLTAYLDNSATTRPLDLVIRAMENSMTEGFYNPSSLYSPGFTARKRVDACRQLIKDKLGAKDVLFTAGGTEADNLAILGHMGKIRQRRRVIYSMAEHPAVTEACKALTDRHEVCPVPLRPDGVMDLDAFSKLLNADTALVCVMQVNNEVGAVQPLEEAVKLRDKVCPEAVFHVDGVQGFLRLPVFLSNGVDSYALSAHKIHGPKGIGALALGKRSRLNPIMLGGGQENGLRSGTENTPGIAGMEAAIAHYPVSQDMRALKNRLLSLLRGDLPEVSVNGPDPQSLLACDHILNVSFPPVRAETMMHALEGMGVYVSHGSACSSKRRKSSPVLTAMRLSIVRMDSAIRFSLSPFTTRGEIEYAAASCISVYKSLSKYKRK